jgi:hypothetical protein
MEQGKWLGAAAGMLRESDEALFRRVWQRVRGGAEAGEEALYAPERAGMPPRNREQADDGELHRAGAAAVPAQALPENRDLVSGLRASIEEELEDWRSYRDAGLACPVQEAGP